MEALGGPWLGSVMKVAVKRCGVARVWFEFFGAWEIERRPRGASQHKAAPTSVSGQSCLCQTRATALFIRRDIEPCTGGSRAIAPGLTGPKQM
ncbi:protein of unknown function [Pseudomonas sp. JV551A1]|uniref:Uncharacterized protein n=1 Tax=Pseudomonas inefficax TaxID=2078786 RepID=A0AAQ1SU13_9PSED|nr:protein of unknown function [Pseudomonas sp. JV551A1]SPO61497.1 protein of unknown function [Pseudomonas inefficax]